jgi:thiol-disulfide isomerase/thioredoxin
VKALKQWSLAIALGFCSCLALAQATATPPSTEALFAATLNTLQDKPQALAKWQGKPLIVNFWARWCPPCRAEIPEFVKLHHDYKSKGLEVIGIGIEDQAEAVRDFAKAYDMDYTLLLGKDKGMDLMRALGNVRLGLPFTVAIDRTGKIVATKTGGIKGDELVAAANAALK